jgi:hypothetical protein
VDGIQLTFHRPQPVTGVAWGALAQVVVRDLSIYLFNLLTLRWYQYHIVPMMIMVRVGIARNTGEQEGNLHTFYGGNGSSFAMNPLLKNSTQ